MRSGRTSLSVRDVAAGLRRMRDDPEGADDHWGNVAGDLVRNHGLRP
jgi:hypothetical protein